MLQVSASRARQLWHTWVTPGVAPRELPRPLLIAVFRLWLVALLLKMFGAGWDMSWHFRWLRDDLAPPHLLNSVGTTLAVALVAFHSYTGYGVDRRALRLMQVGTGIFLFAIPVDVVNHRVNGLDITAWSISHALLYLGTAVMLAGVIDAWAKFGPAGPKEGRRGGYRHRGHDLVLGVLWLFFLENVLFPAGQQEYGVLSVAAWDAGQPEAEPILLQFAADQIGRPVDRTAILRFALPVPSWVYLAWLIGAAMLVLVVARRMIGRPWTATAIVSGYLAYRCVTWVLLAGAGFPRSAIPFLLLGGAVAVDLVMAGRLLPARVSRFTRPTLGAATVAAGVCVGAWAQANFLVLPPVDYRAAVPAAAILAACWFTMELRVGTPRVAHSDDLE